MKNIVAVALLSAVFAAPAFADDAAAVTPAQKNAHAKFQAHKHAHKMAGMKEECDTKHKEMVAHEPGMMMGEHGRGMMGGHAMGMMGGNMEMMMEPDRHLLDALNLSEEQRAKVNKLADELRHNNWSTQGLINDETARLRDLYEADKRDPAAIGKEYQKVFDLKRQMIETYLDTQNRIEEVLTDEQRARMKEERRHMRSVYGHGMH
ncbi:MAG: Spy/CpxP family protein refolding chaperone [Nitrosomonadales bacterium]|nr:Spy/CpxP family protein refolding chaperone [Nitrosomonadales bacterium]